MTTPTFRQLVAADWRVFALFVAALFGGGVTAHRVGSGIIGPGQAPVVNPLWVQQDVYFDVANVTGLALDTNDGKTSSTPLRTHGEWGIHRWGGWCSTRIQGGITVTFHELSTPTDDSDPWPVCMTLEGGSLFKIVANFPSAVATGTFVNSTPKNRPLGTAQSIISAGWTSQGVNGFTFINDTTSGVRAWCIIKPATAQCLTTAPMNAVTTPITLPGGMAPTQFDVTSGNTDSYQLYANLVGVNVTSLEPRVTDPSGSAAVVFQNVRLLSPTGINTSTVRWGSDVVGVESRIDRKIQLVGSNGDTGESGCINCMLDADLVGGRLSSGRYWRWVGGYIGPTLTSPPIVVNVTGNGVALAGDPWLATSASFPDGVQIETVMLGSTPDGGVGLQLGPSQISLGGVSYIERIYASYDAGPSIWGGGEGGFGGSVNVVNTLKYDSSQGGITNAISGNQILCNGLTSAYSLTQITPNPSVWTPTVALNQSTIDCAPAGSTCFNGNVYGLFGCRIVASVN